MDCPLLFCMYTHLYAKSWMLSLVTDRNVGPAPSGIRNKGVLGANHVEHTCVAAPLSIISSALVVAASWALSCGFCAVVCCSSGEHAVVPTAAIRRWTSEMK